MSLERHRVTPFLWYDGQAEEAARHYVSVFEKGSRVVSVSPMSVTFELEGQPFIALNGGPTFKFSEAVSLFVHCKDQREVDYYWRRLGEGGKSGQCGWLKDRWGLSWQVVPRALSTCLNGRDKAGAQRAMEAMLGMGKLDVKRLREAYAGNGRARNADSTSRKGAADMGAQKGEKAPRAVGLRTDDSRARSDVEAFLESKAHPLEAEIHQLRKLMLGLSPSIREEIKWNSVSFRNETDFFATVYLRARSTVQLILFTGVKKKATAETGVPVDDHAGIIEKWLAKDRCLVSLGVGRAFKANREALLALVTAWIRFV